MNEYLTFQKMLTPVVIQIIFWILTVIVILSALTLMFQGSFWYGLMVLIFGPLLVRIYCELMIIMFRIHDCLCEIRDK